MDGACSQNGGASYTIESPATKIPLQEMDRKAQEMTKEGRKGRWSERRWSYLVHELGNPKPKTRESWKQRIEEAKAPYGP